MFFHSKLPILVCCIAVILTVLGSELFTTSFMHNLMAKVHSKHLPNCRLAKVNLQQCYRAHYAYFTRTAIRY